MIEKASMLNLVRILGSPKRLLSKDQICSASWLHAISILFACVDKTRVNTPKWQYTYVAKKLLFLQKSQVDEHKKTREIEYPQVCDSCLELS